MAREIPMSMFRRRRRFRKRRRTFRLRRRTSRLIRRKITGYDGTYYSKCLVTKAIPYSTVINAGYMVVGWGNFIGSSAHTIEVN